MQKPYEAKTEEIDGIKYTIQWFIEEDYYDLSFLGRWTERLTDLKDHEMFFVDRDTGKMYGRELPEPDWEDFSDAEDYDDMTVEEEDAYDAAFEEWNDNYGREVVAQYLRRRGRNEYRYWIAACEWRGMAEFYTNKENRSVHFHEHVGPKLSNFSIALPKTDDPDELGYKAETLYACQDYRRCVTAGTDWWYTWCKVTAYFNGHELDYDCLFGIESDSQDEYFEQIEKELINELQAKLPDILADLVSTVDGLKQIVEEV